MKHVPSVVAATGPHTSRGTHVGVRPRHRTALPSRHSRCHGPPSESGTQKPVTAVSCETSGPRPQSATVGSAAPAGVGDGASAAGEGLGAAHATAFTWTRSSGQDTGAASVIVTSTDRGDASPGSSCATVKKNGAAGSVKPCSEAQLVQSGRQPCNSCSQSGVRARLFAPSRHERREKQHVAGASPHTGQALAAPADEHHRGVRVGPRRGRRRAQRKQPRRRWRRRSAQALAQDSASASMRASGLGSARAW